MSAEASTILADERSDPDYADRLIGEMEAASYLGYTVRALQNWRVRGGGPRYIRVSRRSIRYRRRDLREWADGRLEEHTPPRQRKAEQAAGPREPQPSPNDVDWEAPELPDPPDEKTLRFGFVPRKRS